MYIVFIAPPISEKDMPTDYKAIIDVSKKMGNKVNKDFITSSTSKPENIEKLYKKVTTEIKNADAVIAEATLLTVEVSRLISIALQNHIPTLVLYKGKSPQAFVFEPSRLLLMKHYSLETLQKVLSDHLKKISKKKLIYRFNLMLSKELGSYVMDKSREHRISKADYIRKLILTDMEKK